VVDLYRAADLLVFASRAEGCPNVVLEAMACGIPVVATDVAGNREVIGGDGTAGRLVPTDEPTALAEAVSVLAGSASLRREMGAAARERILERFDIDRVGAQYLSLYEDLLDPAVHTPCDQRL
jgi:glycosyltransferase involved in cell wall biosynthesis